MGLQNNTTGPNSDLYTDLVKDLKISPPMSYVFVAQGALILFINGAIVLFILLRKKVRTNLKNCILASLFISHAFIGLFCCYLPYRQGSIANGIVDFGSTIMIASFCNLMLVTTDRFLAIYYPMSYSHITPAIVVAAIIAVWLIPILFMLSTLVYQKLSQLAFVLVTSISMVTLLVENVLIFAIVRQQVKKIKRVLVPSNESLDHEGKQNKTAHEASHHRAFFVCLAMVLSYVIFWMPATVYVLYDLLLGQGVTDKGYLSFIVFLVFCNSISDPIIYTWFNRKLKTRIKQFVSERRGRAMTQLSLMEQSRN